MADPAPERADRLAQRLALSMGNPDLLDLAITHRSYAFENGGIATNERLEFLGDAVLSLVVTDVIYRVHPEAQEGQLAKIRAAAVKASSLADVARDIGLGPFVKLGRGEQMSGGSDKDSILADTLEAVIGAVYIDQGFGAAFDFVRGLFAEVLDELAGKGPALDFKTSLQELVAARFEGVPNYRVTDTGPDHDKTFTATVSIEGSERGSGTGPSKKVAEQRAAKQAYGELEADLALRKAVSAEGSTDVATR